MAETLFNSMCTKILPTLQNLIKSSIITNCLRVNHNQIQIRFMNRHTTKRVTNLNLSKLTDFEKSNKYNEWYHVERCLPLKQVPTPKEFDNYAPSGWIPPKTAAISHPYFIPRTKNYMIPVYLNISHRGLKHITIVKKIQGNIWKLEEELKKFLKSKCQKCQNIPSQVNEMTGQIRFQGDYAAHINQWLILKGF